MIAVKTLILFCAAGIFLLALQGCTGAGIHTSATEDVSSQLTSHERYARDLALAEEFFQQGDAENLARITPELMEYEFAAEPNFLPYFFVAYLEHRRGNRGEAIAMIDQFYDMSLAEWRLQDCPSERSEDQPDELWVEVMCSETFLPRSQYAPGAAYDVLRRFGSYTAELQCLMIRGSGTRARLNCDVEVPYRVWVGTTYQFDNATIVSSSGHAPFDSGVLWMLDVLEIRTADGEDRTIYQTHLSDDHLLPAQGEVCSITAEGYGINGNTALGNVESHPPQLLATYMVCGDETYGE